MQFIAFILGVISFFCALIPVWGVLFGILALIGLSLGLHSLIFIDSKFKNSKEKKSKKKQEAEKLHYRNSLALGIIVNLSALFVVIIHVFSLLLIYGSYFNKIFYISSKKTSKTENTVINTTATNTVSNIIAPEAEIETEEIDETLLMAGKDSVITVSGTYSLTEPFSINYVNLVFTDFNPNYIINNSDGNVVSQQKVISASFEFQNLSEKDLIVNDSNFSVLDENNNKCNRYFPDGNKEAYEGKRLSPQEKYNTTLYFIVPTKLNKINISYNFYPYIAAEPTFEAIINE